MIPLPTGDPFVHENSFYLSCQPNRIGKLLAQAELFRMTLDVPGAVVECGVFKGSSFLRWAMFRELFCDVEAKKLVAFDTFGKYADTFYGSRDTELRDAVVKGAGNDCISPEQLKEVLATKGCENNVDICVGFVEDSVPQYIKERPEFRISLLNIDLDFKSGSRVAITNLWPRVSVGGIMILDDHTIFQGETEAVEEALPGARIQKFPYSHGPCFLVKE